MLITWIVRFVLWLTGIVLCKVLRIHWYVPKAVRFARQVEMVPHMTRIVLRYTDRECALCLHKSATVDRARVAHDWQHPERLFK